MKNFKTISALILSGALSVACTTTKVVTKVPGRSADISAHAAAGSNTWNNTFREAMQSITATDLKKHLYIIAADDMQGRDTGSEGQKKAGRYITDYYAKLKMAVPAGMQNYYQHVPAQYMNKLSGGGSFNDSENIIAYVPGTDKKDEYIIISAHYDHVGMDGTVVYNGADDDGSGTVAVMELAEAFQKAANAGHGPRRSVVFLHVTGEEHGLFGSSYYAEHPIFPLEKTVADLNIDMIGRDDAANRGKQYVYVIGSAMLSTELKKINELANATFTGLELNYKYDDPNDPDRLYYRSDHYNFAKHNIPVAFFFDGIHEDYHQPTDDPEKIDYALLQKRAQLIFATGWELANRAERIKVDAK